MMGDNENKLQTFLLKEKYVFTMIARNKTLLNAITYHN